MATVQTRIDRALRLIGQIEAGESPTTDETADALVALNAMLDTWRNDRLMCFAFQTETLTLSASTASYTVGAGGDLSTTRPVEILRAWITSSDQDYPMRAINEGEYAAIFDKTSEADWPDRYLFRPSIASGLATIIFYPVPNATRTAKLTTRVAVSAFSAATDTVTLPPGWEAAIDANLAIALAPEYGVSAPPEVRQMALSALAGIKRTNALAQPRRLHNDLNALSGRSSANIMTDEA